MKKIDIKEEALKVINKINEKNPYYLLIGVLIFLLVFDYLLLMQFQLKAIQKLGPRIIEISDNFKQFELDRSRVAKYKNDIFYLDNQLGQLEKRIKTTEEIPVVLEELSRIANHHKFFVEQILPEMQLGKPVLKDNTGNYYLLPVMVQGRGSYHGFGKFLNELETAGSLMRIEMLSINENVENPRQHNIRFKMQTVIFEPGKRTQK